MVLRTPALPAFASVNSPLINCIIRYLKCQWTWKGVLVRPGKRSQRKWTPSAVIVVPSHAPSFFFFFFFFLFWGGGGGGGKYVK